MFEDVFAAGNKTKANFLSRIFGIYYESIIRIWLDDDRSLYRNLGRPTIHTKDGLRYTVDFLLEDTLGRKFVTEAKCEIAYQNFKYLTLDSSSHLDHHKKGSATFRTLLDMAKNTQEYTVTCQGIKVEVAGAGLIWGRTSGKGIQETRGKYAIAIFLSVEDMIRDLNTWHSREYKAFSDDRKNWVLSMFDDLTYCRE